MQSTATLHLTGKYLLWSNTNYDQLWWVQHIVTNHFDFLWIYSRNHSKESNSTIICDILNVESLSGKFRYRNQTNILILSWSNFSKTNIQIQSWSEKIPSILQDIQSWSSPCSPLLFSRDEHWTWLGLDWNRTIANFVEFGLDPGYKFLWNVGSGADLDWVNREEMRYFRCENPAFFKLFGLHLDFTFEKYFWL